MADAAFDLARCLELVAAGNQQAAGDLVERMYPLVSKIVRSYTRDAGRREDWQQESFVRMFAALDQFRGAAPFEHWLARIAVNVCRDGMRVQRRRRELRWADLDPAEAELAHTAAELCSAEQAGDALVARELAQKMLEALAVDDRIIVQMLDLEGRSIAEVAQFTGRSRTAVKVRAFRARRKLEKMWHRLVGEAPSKPADPNQREA